MRAVRQRVRPHDGGTCEICIVIENQIIDTNRKYIYFSKLFPMVEVSPKVKGIESRILDIESQIMDIEKARIWISKDSLL